jgi:cytochrome c
VAKACGRAWAALSASILFAVTAASTAAEPPAARGERLFQLCYACHSVDPRETGLPGPNLRGVVGRPAGAEPGFAYSPAMRTAGRAGLIWTEAQLDAFLAGPAAMLPGVFMDFRGLQDPADRAAMIAYLKTRSRP